MIRKQSRREWSDKMSDIQNERLIEFISNSKVAFINGQFQEAFTLAKEAIKLDENCADAYQLSLIHISEPTRLLSISYAVFCLKKKKTKTTYLLLNSLH